MHPNIRMRKNHLGKGLYAIAPIKEGEVIYNTAHSTTLVRVGMYFSFFICNSLQQFILPYSLR